jgi:hypothetical protein
MLEFLKPYTSGLLALWTLKHHHNTSGTTRARVGAIAAMMVSPRRNVAVSRAIANLVAAA